MNKYTVASNRYAFIVVYDSQQFTICMSRILTTI
jgi:hypothetical protein